MYFLVNVLFWFEASRGAVARSVAWLIVGSIPIRGDEIVIYIYIFISYFGVEAKRGVEFCHSIRNASRIRRKVGIECLNTRFLMPTLLCAEYSVKQIFLCFVLLSLVSY